MQTDMDAFWKRQDEIYKQAYVSIILLVLNITVFIMSNTITPEFYEKGAMITENILNEGEFYRIFTSMFLHADVTHIFNNMIIMVLAGGIVENYTGHLYYLVLYLLSGFFGNILSMAYEVRNSLNWISVGASGAIMGVVGFLVAWIIANRRLFLKRKETVFRMMFLAIFVIQACFFQEEANTAAHLGGFLTGFVLGVINIVVFRNNKFMEGLV